MKTISKILKVGKVYIKFDVMAKNSKKKIPDYLVWERISQEFLTEKERKSFEQVEKYVSKNREKTAQKISDRKNWRAVASVYSQDKSSSISDDKAWLEFMIAQVAQQTKVDWRNNRKKWTNILYIIYLILICVAIIFCMKYYLWEYVWF